MPGAVAVRLAARAVAVAVGLLAAPEGAPAQAPAVSAFPVPGARTVSTGTQISFRGAPPEALGPIEVTGSRSGAHPGELRAHSDGLGASFVPAAPFRSGEAITVRTALDVRGARDGDFRLRVAGNQAPPTTGVPPLPRVSEPSPPAERPPLESRADLSPPAIVMTRRAAAGTTPGVVLIAPKRLFGRRRAGEQQGPMILDGRGEIVWFRPLRRGVDAADLRVQSYRGQPVLTWWEGRNLAGRGAGEGVILDASYRALKRVRGGNGYALDLHEFLLTPQGTALVQAYVPVDADLSPAGGARNGRLLDNVVQEIDLETGLVLFEWHSADAIRHDESYERPPRRARDAWDSFHLNSIDVDTDGNLLLSARHAWGVYKLDRTTGAVIWRLGGKRSDFRMGRGTRVAWAHDARRRPDGTIGIFDNAASPRVRERSRAIIVALDEAARTATLVRAFTHPDGLLAATQGNMQHLPNGNVFVGWGSRSHFSEYAPDGRLLFDGRPQRGFDSYRAYRAEWTGRPATAPAVAGVARGGGRVAVFASWNGATDVARWQVLMGPRPDALRAVGVGARTGLETGLLVRTGERCVAVRALDAGGQVIGTSRVERVRAR